MMVASTPMEFPLITASSLSSNTLRPIPKAYVAHPQRRSRIRRQPAACWNWIITRFPAFLRRVNVGGVNLTTAEVTTAFTDVGFTTVRTILASGNVLSESCSGVAAVRKKAEATWWERFGYDACLTLPEFG